MAFKKIKKNINEEIFETKVLDVDGKLLSKWRCLKSDYPKVFRILSNKFDIKEKKDKKKDKLGWAM